MPQENPIPDAQRHLSASEARYRTLVENPNLGVFLIDRQGNYLFVNSKILEMTGYTPEEFVSKSRMGFTITHPDDHAVGMRAFRKALLGRSSQHNEFRLLHRNGECRWSSASCYPVRDEDGGVSAIQVVVQDITELKLAEEALALETSMRQAEAAIRLRIARMEHNRDLLDVVDEISGQLTTLGIEHDACSIQIVNKDGTDFICCGAHLDRSELSGDLDSLRDLSWAARSDNMERSPWVGQVWRSGHPRCAPATDATSGMVPGAAQIDVPFSHGTLAISRQSTDAYVEADVEALQRLGGVLSEGFQRCIDLMRHERLEEQFRESQKMEALGQLVAGVSHNFNNLLMVILGNLELTREEMPSSRHLDDAFDASRQAAEVIEELMLFSRRGPTDKDLTDMEHLVGQAITLCQRTIGDGIDVRLTVHGTPPPAFGNASRLQQMVINLCLNARDAIEAAPGASSRIDVDIDEVDVPHPPLPSTAASLARWLRLRVRDDGIGIDDQVRARLFEPFFTTKRAGKGTGLGLSTAYAIIHDHGGWIDVVSEPGQGAEFSIYLPAASGKRAHDDKPAPQPHRGSGETVLVVDDDTAVRRVLRAVLERAGYAVRECGDGETALQAVADKPEQIALILLDLSMPGLSGQQVLEQLGTDADAPKVVILTGQSVDPGQLPGAAAIIAKPVPPDELLHTIRRLIDA